MAKTSSELSINAVEEPAVHFKKFLRFKFVDLVNLGYYFVNDLTMHVCKAERSALKLIGKFFVIKSQLV